MAKVGNVMKWCIRMLGGVLLAGCGELSSQQAPSAPLVKDLAPYQLVYSDGQFPSEQPLEVRLKTLPAGSTVQGRIEGINMTMGTIPLFLQQDKPGEWSGQFMLGACSEPVMHWQLTLVVTDSKGQSTTLTDRFDVTRR